MSSAGSPDLAVELLCELKGLTFVSELGRGAYKRAYLVVDRSGRELALKIAPIVGSIDRLQRETDALRGCAHPNVATLIDAYPLILDGQNVWVALEEFVSGGTLEAKLAAGPLDSAQTLSIGRDLASVLLHLRERNLVHRDIKPANILFASNGVTPVLTDFGVVRMLDQPSLTRDFLGMGPGTPAYSAPEQLNNDKSLIDWRTDQFSLAIVLAECVLGRHPYVQAPGLLTDAILSVAARNGLPDATVTELHERGLGVLVKALAPWPVQRYSRPTDLIEALS